jgi:NAD-dependent deacetylase
MPTETRIASDDEILAAARMLTDAQYPIALTGAGLSVESGIPPFRGPGGLWTKYGEPPMNGYQLFLADPKKGWEERIRRQDDELWRPLKVARPNPGHVALATMESLGVLRFLITQNVDDLHRQAGHQALAEIHGNWKLIRCIDCNARFGSAEVSLEVLPPTCSRCEGVLKSDTVSFGEPIPADVLNQCMTNAAKADLVLVAGTSATVYPAAGFAIEVKQRGGILIEANLYESEITPICDISLRGPTGEILPRLTGVVSELRKEKLSEVSEAEIGACFAER